MPNIYPTGVVSITGTGSYTAANYMYIPNDINNQGVLNFQDIGLFAAATNDLTGGGTLNLTNIRVVGNLKSYSMFGNITNQTINLNNSYLNISGSYNNVTINLSSTGNNYIGIPKAANAVNLKIRGLGSNSQIDLQDVDLEGYSYDPETGILRISDTNMTKILYVDIGLGYDPSGFRSISGPFGTMSTGISYIYRAPCFLRDSLIETPSGSRAVQDLSAGDLVWSIRNGRRYAVPVKKVISDVRIVNPSLPDDEASYAICIKKGALDEGCPTKDMFITSDHSLYLNQNLIPVRMLVNDTSIFYDKTRNYYDYYHLDLGKHHIIIADGVETESYLPRLQDMITDTRDAFRHAQRLIVPAAPINTARHFVEPIFHRIAARAGIVPSPLAQLCQSGLCLRLADGTVLQAESRNKGRYVFRLPADTRRVTLVSEAVRPCDLYGPFVDDRRALGVLVGHIALESTTHSVPVESHLQERPLQGWYADRGEACRWTNGQGTLSLPTIADGVSTLSIEVLNEPAQQDNNADSGISDAAA